LEAELYVGVDVGGDADVGVAQQVVDHDEVDACSRRRVAVEWRRSWKRMRRSPARLRKLRKWRVRSAGSRGLLVGGLKEWMHSVGSAVQRSEARVLVGSFHGIGSCGAPSWSSSVRSRPVRKPLVAR
jgi:hypothetical protein